MKITRDWIHDNKSANGGWNSAQLAAVGVEWPLTKGWIDRLLEVELTAEQLALFKHLRTKRDYFYRCRECGRTSEKPYSTCPHCMTESVGEYVVTKRERSDKQKDMFT